MTQKKVTFDQPGIQKLPNDKPVLYRIVDEAGTPNYIGVAQRGRVRERIAEHLPGSKDPIPGKRVVIEQFSRIAEAREKEPRVIKRNQPKYNKQGL